MHVQHHTASLSNLNTPQARKPGTQEDGSAYSQVSNGTDGGASRGRRQPSNRRAMGQPALPTTSGLLKPRQVSQGKLAPFMAVTSVTQFWTELVMADNQTGAPEMVPDTAPSDTPSLLDLFADAVK